ncbi:class II glutamine amidotransferase [Microbispora sp. NPDC049125]|uniref:class II glutamine amidotransferase n=1 Tax=Microbispora sp. NPDC049125 TaxID=3154929 RepID=UPI0034677CB1
MGDLIFKPSYGLPRQAARPRWQQIELVNRDGFGVGWFPSPGRAASYRRTGPIEADPGFPELARSVAGGCLIGAVRGASPGMPIEEAATAPFTNGRALMSLNGHVNVGLTLPLLEAGYHPESTCDAAFLATLLWQRLDDAVPLETAVEELLGDVIARDPHACLNMLATDGAVIVATTWAETLCYRAGPEGVLVASEPHDDEPGWVEVPDRHILVADAMGVRVRALEPAVAALPAVADVA